MATTKSTKRRMSKAERQQAREAAQAKAQAALDRLGEGVRAVYDSKRWESWLRSLAKFHDYSLNNTLLIAMQMPTATQVASFRSWKRDFNRHVRKGERGEFESEFPPVSFTGRVHAAIGPSALRAPAEGDASPGAQRKGGRRCRRPPR